MAHKAVRVVRLEDMRSRTMRGDACAIERFEHENGIVNTSVLVLSHYHSEDVVVVAATTCDVGSRYPRKTVRSVTSFFGPGEVDDIAHVRRPSVLTLYEALHAAKEQHARAVEATKNGALLRSVEASGS